MSDDGGRPDGLTHLDAQGHAHMVDVTGKDETRRAATATGVLRMSRTAFDRIREGSLPKGDVLATARIAGIMAGKRTAELIPLCHALPGASVEVALELREDLPGVQVSATARVKGQTGVEMEALTAASVALLTVYDMAKAIDRGMELGEIRLEQKSGGRSGAWSRSETP